MSGLVTCFTTERGEEEAGAGRAVELICGDRVGGPGDTNGWVLVEITLVAAAGAPAAASGAALRGGGLSGGAAGRGTFWLTLAGATLYCMVVPDGIVIVCGRELDACRYSSPALDWLTWMGVMTLVWMGAIIPW